MEAFEWEANAIARWSGSEPIITGVVLLPSRTAELHRITAVIRGAEHRFYAKRYPPNDTDGEALAKRAADLRHIANTIERASGLQPFRVVDYEPERRMLLTAETPGQPLGRIQRALCWNPRARQVAIEAWRGVGAWLGSLHWHSLDPVISTTRSSELVSYTVKRLRFWCEEDRRRLDLAKRAEEAVHLAGAALEGHPVTLVPCHGDVTTFNILIGHGVGLIDLDDFRFDMPALDISQALLELDQFSTCASAIRLTGVRTRSWQLFREAYAHAFPSGAEFWLPHLRNLAVLVLTLARRRRGGLVSKISTGLHYARILAELETSTAAVLQSKAQADYLRLA